VSDTKALAGRIDEYLTEIGHRGPTIYQGLLGEAQAELLRLDALINTPETEDFLKGVEHEAVHQQERWGSEHDEGKSAVDWVFLIGHLLTKASCAFLAGNTDKAKHHIITSAAACRNWHAQVSGEGNAMRPGISMYEQEGGKAYREGRAMVTNPYAKKGPAGAADAWATGYRKASLYDSRANG
jgi:hypothetical protein